MAGQLYRSPEDILLLELLFKCAYHHAFELSSRAAEYINEVVASKGSGPVQIVNAVQLNGAPLYLLSLGQQQETEGEASMDRFDGNCLPFSPVLLGALHLACGDCGVLVDFMPTHIKGRLKVLQANKTSTKDEEERRAFFEKFSDGFQRNLKNLLLCCVSACALDARNGRAFSLLLQVLSLRAESDATLPAMLDTSPVSEELFALVAHFKNECSMDTLFVSGRKGKDPDWLTLSPELFPHARFPESFYKAKKADGGIGTPLREWMYSALFYFHHVHATSPSQVYLSSLCQHLRDHREYVAAGYVKGEEACWSLCQLIGLHKCVCTALEKENASNRLV